MSLRYVLVGEHSSGKLQTKITDLEYARHHDTYSFNVEVVRALARFLRSTYLTFRERGTPAFTAVPLTEQHRPTYVCTGKLTRANWRLQS